MLYISFVLKSLKNQTIKQATVFYVNIESNLYLKTEIIYKLFILNHEIKVIFYISLRLHVMTKIYLIYEAFIKWASIYCQELCWASFPGDASGKEHACQCRRHETRVSSLGQEDSLEESMATHSSIFAWSIPWTEEPGGLYSKGLQRVGHNWSVNFHNP